MKLESLWAVKELVDFLLNHPYCPQDLEKDLKVNFYVGGFSFSVQAHHDRFGDVYFSYYIPYDGRWPFKVVTGGLTEEIPVTLESLKVDLDEKLRRDFRLKAETYADL